MKSRGMRILALYRAGKTYREIREVTRDPKSVIHYWIKRYGKLGERDRKKLEAHRERRREEARKRGLQKIALRRANHRTLLENESKRQFESLCKDPFFLFGLALYAGEGGKKELAMANLDCKLLAIFVKWVRKYLDRNAGFSGSIFASGRHGYSRICRQIERLIKVKVRWAKFPLSPKSKGMEYARNYGVVLLKVRGVHLGWFKVGTWINCAVGRWA